MQDRATYTSGNLVLTGFMGTGKTTVGRLLASRLGFDFVDTDRLIEQRHGPIPQIFSEHGEDEFRRLERDVAAELATRDRLVISTGGRMMVDPINADLLSTSGEVFCLAASVDTILARVTRDRSPVERPLLSGADVRTRIGLLLAERAAAYRRFRQIDTEGRTPDEVAGEILDLVLTERD